MDKKKRPGGNKLKTKKEAAANVGQKPVETGLGPVKLAELDRFKAKLRHDYKNIISCLEGQRESLGDDGDFDLKEFPVVVYLRPNNLNWRPYHDDLEAMLGLRIRCEVKTQIKGEMRFDGKPPRRGWMRYGLGIGTVACLSDLRPAAKRLDDISHETLDRLSFIESIMPVKPTPEGPPPLHPLPKDRCGGARGGARGSRYF